MSEPLPASAEPKFLSRGPFTPEHIAWLFERLTGQSTSPEELVELRREMAAMEEERL